jgi:ribosomal protein L37AE/L43A
MTATDAVGSFIDRLLERRYGVRYSPKWWKRYHDQTHRHMVMLACPECPDAAELGRMMVEDGFYAAMSYNDCQAAMAAYWAGASEKGTGGAPTDE